MPDSFTLFGPARWTRPDGRKTYNLATVSLNQAFERRIVVRKRPYLDGAPLDDTGAEPGAHELAFGFWNGHGVANVPEPAYPEYHLEMLEAFQLKGTSTLYIPGRGEKRIRIKMVRSSQYPTERDCEVIAISILEDAEEERVTAAAFVLPSAKSAPPVLARAVASWAEPIGFAGDLLDLVTFATTKLTAAVNAPFDSADAIQQRVDALHGAIGRLEDAIVTTPARAGALPLATPEAVLTLGALGMLRDSASAQVSATYGTGTVRPRTFREVVSIFDVANRTGNDAADLMRLNARLPSLFAIAPGTPVLCRA